MFKSSQSESVAHEIIVSVGAPYKPPRERSSAANTGCMLVLGGEPAQEVCGTDELEALQVAIAHIEFFLREMATNQSGELRGEDGALADPNGPPFLKNYIAATRRI